MGANAEIARRAVESFDAHDGEAMRVLVREDVVLRLIGGFAALQGEEFVGRDAVVGWMLDWVETIGGTTEIESIEDVDGKVLVMLRIDTVGTASGAATSARSGLVFSFRDNLISAVEGYYEPDQARRAVGLTK
jgi:ketosteroid isomerase-like protein